MTPDEARSLGRAIRAARMAAGLTQLKLAVAIGVKSPWISAWERGQSQPTAYRQATPPAVIGWQIGLVGTAGPASWYRCSGDPEPARA